MPSKSNQTIVLIVGLVSAAVSGCLSQLQLNDAPEARVTAGGSDDWPKAKDHIVAPAAALARQTSCLERMENETAAETAARLTNTVAFVMAHAPEISEDEAIPIAWAMRERKCEAPAPAWVVTNRVESVEVDVGEKFAQFASTARAGLLREGLMLLRDGRLSPAEHLHYTSAVEEIHSRLADVAAENRGRTVVLVEDTIRVGANSIGYNKFIKSTCGDHPDLCSQVQFSVLLDGLPPDASGTINYYLDPKGEKKDPTNILIVMEDGIQPQMPVLMNDAGWDLASCGSKKWLTLYDRQHGGETARTTQWEDYAIESFYCPGDRYHLRHWTSIPGDTHADLGYVAAAARYEEDFTHKVMSYDWGRDRLKNDMQDMWYVLGYPAYVWANNEHNPDGDGRKVVLALQSPYAVM